MIPGVFVGGTIATVVNLTHPIEESVTVLTTIYNEAIVLIGGVLAYIFLELECSLSVVN